MGIFHSKVANTADSQLQGYEEKLLAIQTQISKVEEKCTYLRIRKHSINHRILVNGTLLAFLYFVLQILFASKPIFRDRLSITINVLMALLWISCIWLARRTCGWWHSSSLDKQTRKLKALYARQKKQVEELKRMTSFDKTRHILELYDEEGRGKVKRKETLHNNSHHNNVNNDSRNIKSSKQQQAAINAATSPPPKPAQLLYTPPSWTDRILDALMGEDTAHKYALICSQCYAHNGLATMEDFNKIQYICPVCGYLNLPRSSPSPTTATVPINREPCKRSDDGYGDDDSSKKHRSTESSSIASPTDLLDRVKAIDNENEPGKDEQPQENKDPSATSTPKNNKKARKRTTKSK